MPQKNTIKEYVSDSFYHVYARGVNKQSIFNTPADYNHFISLFDRYLSTKSRISRAGVIYPNYSKEIDLNAYCLMGSHFHLLIFQKYDPTSIEKFMRSFMTSYSKYFNLKYNRVGSLFESRYKAKRIDEDSYLVHISRYIHLNPRRWRTYTCSSLGYYRRGSPSWLKPKPILETFENINEYINFLADYESRKTEIEEFKDQLADQT